LPLQPSTTLPHVLPCPLRPAQGRRSRPGSLVQRLGAEISPNRPLGGPGMITAETINHIIRFRGNGLPVAPPHAAGAPGASRWAVRSRVTSLVDRIGPLAKDHSAVHEWQLSLRADIERIKERTGEEDWQPRAIAIFSCSGRGLYEEVPLPRG